jgi:hypothetical protein
MLFPFRIPVGFVSASGFLCTFFGKPSGAPEGFPKVSRRIPEENTKKTGNGYEEVNNGLPDIFRYLFRRGSVNTLHFPVVMTPFFVM